MDDGLSDLMRNTESPAALATSVAPLSGGERTCHLLNVVTSGGNLP